MSDSRKSVAIIGTGMVAQTHLKAIADLKDTLRLEGVHSRTLDHAARFADDAQAALGHPIEIYPDIDAICADEAVDFALVLTPPNARLEIVKKLAAAGKAILLEKPIERTTTAARHIVETCEKAEVPLGVVFQHRVREASRKLADLIEGGTLGPLVIAETNVPWWRDQSYYDAPGRGTYARDGGGVLMTQAIHTMELMLSLTGPVSQVQAMSHTTALHDMEAEDYVTAALRFANGAAGSLIASTAHYPGDPESITLHCQNAVAHLARGELTLTWRDGRKEQFGASASTGGGADPMAFTSDWHRDIIADFVVALTDNRPPLITGRTALGVHELIEAITASSDQGRAITL